MPFKIKGNSNYELKLENNIVTKYSTVEDPRLIVSANKQNEFKSNYFKTPKIYEINESSFSMEYINGESFIEFFGRASKRDLDGLIYKIDGYIQENILGDYNLPIDILKQKIKQIPSAKNVLINFKEKEYIKVKVGKCHGDFTFSNMVFAENIYLIDFLDSYIDSPTIDIVKIRQDTHLYWSLNMVNDVRDVIKVKLGLKYIDDWITSKYPVEDYNLLQAINLSRIIPYAKTPKIQEYLKQNITKLCER